MAKALLLDGTIIIHASFREREMMKTIPGAKWKNAAGVWYMPLAWSSLASLRGTFGPEFEMDEEVLAWAWNERRRVDSALAARSAIIEGGYGFQEVGVRFLRAAGSALLADEMGLGKTRQAILAADTPVLVVCPNSMKYAWANEWAKWRPECSVAVVDGTPGAKKKAVESGADVVVVNWESLRTYSRLAPYGSIRLTDKQREPGVLNRAWGTVIADEAHRAKDPASQQTRALWAVASTAQRRIALSGTPVANSPADLWSIMHFVEPSEWPSRNAFIDRYCIASTNFWGGLDVVALRPERRTEMDAFFLPRFLRRQKSEVLTQLPSKTYATRMVGLTTQQYKVYETLRKEMLALVDDGVLAAFDPLVQTLRLLQVASAMPVLGEDGAVVALTTPSNKLDALQGILEEAGGQPLVTFAQSRKLIELCAGAVGMDHVLITGGQSPAERAANVARFQTGTVPLALVTLGAGGEGITLTAASTAVFLQRSWSLVQNLQAEDRIHRIGQDAEAVNIIDVVSMGTIEQKVHEAFADKEMTLADVMKDKAVLRSLLV